MCCHLIKPAPSCPCPHLPQRPCASTQVQAEGKPVKRQKQGGTKQDAGKKAAAKQRPAAVADKENTGAANAAAGAAAGAAPKSRLEDRPLAALTDK